MWKNVQPDRPQIAKWLMRIACRIPTATSSYTLRLCTIVIAFSLQKWLHENASTLRYTHIACLVYNNLSLFTLRMKRKRKYFVRKREILHLETGGISSVFTSVPYRVKAVRKKEDSPMHTMQNLDRIFKR